MKLRCETRRFKSAFTLTEVLVVFVILAVLVALVLPVLSGARERAQGVQCLSNLRSIGIAMNLYAGENQNKFPMGYDSAANQTWDYALVEYLEGSTAAYKRKYFVCPSRKIQGTDKTTYAVHDRICADESSGGHRIGRLAIERPGSCILVADVCQAKADGTVYASFWQPNEMYWQTVPDLGQVVPNSAGSNSDTVDGAGQLRYRHHGRGNVVMIDGHAEMLEIGKMTYGNIWPCSN